MGIRLNDMTCGDTWSFTTEATDYPAPTWTLTLHLVPRNAAHSVITLTSAPDDADGTLHRFEVAAGVTAAYDAGQFGYYTTATDGTERYTLDASEWSGEVTLRANPATLAAGHDGRSGAQKALDNARAALYDAQGRAASLAASGHVVEYQIGDRMMKYASAKEAVESLLSVISALEAEVARERRADAIRRGMADPRHVYVRAYRA